jgi:hypothetical protein
MTGPEHVRRREHAIISCYHEAGHAVMAWHHGIKILYVTMTRADDHAHTGLTATADDDVTSLPEAEARMQVAVAGDMAANWRLPVPEELTDGSLLRRFAHDERVVADSDFARFNDRLIFAWWGRARDEMIRNATPAKASGPASWLPIFGMLSSSSAAICGQPWRR